MNTLRIMARAVETRHLDGTVCSHRLSVVTGLTDIPALYDLPKGSTLLLADASVEPYEAETPGTLFVDGTLRLEQTGHGWLLSRL